ncbi:hypothetical protein Y032_0001g111 [Ancylostoma ceylanicum]|uniref:Uncharacterized protein n=1 Tax=Ancylostoma ceylanicum TaxID=53326 RepID=A0A016W2E7_9BILA|nr:hypothetical protein Y032_0001g111 [Ancylostoma ceylanicum]
MKLYLKRNAVVVVGTIKTLQNKRFYKRGLFLSVAKIRVDKIVKEEGGNIRRNYVTFKTMYYTRVDEWMLRLSLPARYNLYKCPHLEEGKEYIVCCEHVYLCNVMKPYENVTVDEWMMLFKARALY